jgi:N-acetylglucosaminyldiphosphoundecaprenol N-acetyl-beta-D-mannosaminyltransferase
MDTLSAPTYHFLGLRVNALTKRELLDAIQSAVQKHAENCIIGNHNLHSVYLFHRDAEMRRFYDRNLYTHIDGMSVILLARMLGLRLESRRKTSYLDWFDEFLLLAEKASWRIYFRKPQAPR